MTRKSDNYLELKEFFIKNKKTGTVLEWNNLREEAKSYFTAKTIFQLDGLGFIHQWRREQ